MVGVGGGLLQQLFGQEDPVSEPVLSPSPAMHGDEKVLALRLKKKFQMEKMRQMLENAGYGDLAKMSSFSRRDYDDEGY